MHKHRLAVIAAVSSIWNFKFHYKYHEIWFWLRNTVQMTSFYCRVAAGLFYLDIRVSFEKKIQICLEWLKILLSYENKQKSVVEKSIRCKKTVQRTRSTFNENRVQEACQYTCQYTLIEKSHLSKDVCRDCITFRKIIFSSLSTLIDVSLNRIFDY